MESLCVIAQIIKLLFNLHDGVKIIIDQDHISCLLAHISSILSHGDADVSAFQSHAIIHTIARHPNNVPSVLQGLHNSQLVLGCNAIKHANIVDYFLQLHLIELIDVVTADGLLVDGVESDESRCKAKVQNVS